MWGVEIRAAVKAIGSSWGRVESESPGRKLPSKRSSTESVSRGCGNRVEDSRRSWKRAWWRRAKAWVWLQTCLGSWCGCTKPPVHTSPYTPTSVTSHFKCHLWRKVAGSQLSEFAMYYAHPEVLFSLSTVFHGHLYQKYLRGPSWGDGWVGKVHAGPTLGPESTAQSPCEKDQPW